MEKWERPKVGLVEQNQQQELMTISSASPTWLTEN